MIPTKSSLCVVIAVTSETALLDVNKTPSLIRAIHGLQEYWPTLPITVAVSPVDEPAVHLLLKKNRVPHELIICDPNQPRVLAKALASTLGDSEVLLVHDASRPLTSTEQFTRLINALTPSVDAVRPAIAFTETLKIVKSNSVIKETLDRTQVKRIATPELIRTCAIDPKGKDQGWFLPLKKNARTEHVEGSPEALRINTTADRDLLESFLHWRQTSV